MSEMRDRAVTALERVFNDRAMREQVADLVINAALDPEDEALVEIGARALWKAHTFPMPGIAPRTWDRFKEESPFDYEMFRGYAIATLVAFQAAAQGEQTP